MKCWASISMSILWSTFLSFHCAPQCCGFVVLSSTSGASTTTDHRPLSTFQDYHRPLRIKSRLSMANSDSKATLTEETTWRLRFSLTGVPTRLDRKVGELFSVDVKFLEEEGFEPPQGTVVQVVQEESLGNPASSSSKNVNALKIKGGRWKLSEDPNDRKDGLWVWGLFSEPLYPFMLLTIETEEYILTDNKTTGVVRERLRKDTKSNPDPDADADRDAGVMQLSSNYDSILPLKIYAQINHKRDRKMGQVTLEPATLTIRKMETVKADILGAAKVEIYDEIQVGQLSLRPLLMSRADAGIPSGSTTRDALL